MNKFLKSGSPQMIKSDFNAYTDLTRCNNCGNCVEFCYFGARKLIREKLYLFPDNCFGCGLCVSKCPENTITLKSTTN
jgi:MinD superfamily P-loop ATPase